MGQENIVFKGSKRGLLIKANDSIDYDTLRQQIEDKIEKSHNFFANGGTIEISGDNLGQEEKKSLQRYLEDSYGLNVLWQAKETPVESKILELPDRKATELTEEGPTQFVRATIRSGQRYFYQGNIVVFGDVNPGGEVVAGGNIIILGSLRGMAHAGYFGNNKAMISAYRLKPTQLRIGELITRPPDQDAQGGQFISEVAYIKNNIIVIETVS